MKVALLMSGGVDSSYSAYLLQKQGHEVLGIYLKLHDKEEKHKVFIPNCEKVAKNLGFEFIVLEAQEQFKRLCMTILCAPMKMARRQILALCAILI